MNKGLEFEAKMIKRCHAFKSEVKENDMISKSGKTSEVKYFHIEKAENYKEKKAVYNSANAHKWVRDDNGNIDYILTCKAFAEEADRIVFGSGSEANEKATYLNTYENRFNFYFLRLQWKDEKSGRLCTNPISNKGGKKGSTLTGRRLQLQTLKDNGVVNVPTFEEIEAVYNSMK